MELVTNTNSLQEHLPEFVISDIAIEWDWVKLGVEEIISSQANIKNRPEDVYASCKAGESYLLTANKNRFAVVQILNKEYNESFKEDDHPRDGDGKFADKYGGSVSEYLQSEMDL